MHSLRSCRLWLTFAACCKRPLEDQLSAVAGRICPNPPGWARRLSRSNFSSAIVLRLKGAFCLRRIVAYGGTMQIRVAAILPIVLAVGCGGDDESPVDTQVDARSDVKNACGGERPLTFLGRGASPADPCGACGGGALVCAAPEILVCVGTTDGSCPEGGTTNLCGGRGPLTLDRVPSAPGQPCGPCRDGMTICAALEILACVGAGSSSVCRDAGADVAVDASSDSYRDSPPSDAQLSDSSLDTARPDSAPSDSSRDTASTDASFVDADVRNACGGYGPLRYHGVDALLGDWCGTCREGILICESPTTLTCSGQATADVCSSDHAAPNQCGGFGPVYWRGTPIEASSRCGPCSSFFKCASTTTVICEWRSSCADAGPSDGCDLPLSAYTATGPTLPAPPAEAAPVATSATTVPLAANWLVYNPFDFHFYASVGSAQGADGNSIAVIDPYTGTIVKSIFVGSEPTVMALSDDGKVLWVALDGSGAVRQVDLVSGTAGQQFSLGSSGSSGPWFALSLAVLPGTHGSIVVTRHFKGGAVGVDGSIVYDDGVPRAFSAGILDNITLLIPTYSAALMFGYNNANTGFNLTTACINANGIFAKQSGEPFNGFGMTFSFADNVIYSSTGVAYDIATGRLLGTYGGRGPVAAEAPKRRVYFVSLASATTQATVSAYDMDTFLSRGSETVPSTLPASTALANFARWGRYGYAFRANTQSIVIARSALIAATP
jgi:hypothetical protein